MATKPLTHRQLIELAATYARDELRAICDPLIEAPTGRSGERCDVFVIDKQGASIVLEVKCSRDDLLAESRKVRQVGEFRFIAAEKGVFESWQMPDGWGLVEHDPTTGQCVRTRTAPQWHHNIDHHAERKLLAKCIRDLGRKAGRTSEEAKPGRDANLPKALHEKIREYVAVAHEDDPSSPVTLKELGQVYHGSVAGVSKIALRNAILHDIRAGLIEGVEASDDTPAIIRIKTD